jgi:hypothetical protein
MPAFHQMGHDSRNLLADVNLAAFRGAILSPVNETPAEMARTVAEKSSDANFKFIFDPQYYDPRSQRSSLPKWPYFFDDTDTADIANPAFWRRVVEQIIAAASGLPVSAICSPVQLPRVPTDGHYAHAVALGRIMFDELRGTRIEPVQTAIVSLPDVSQRGRALAIASILSTGPCEKICIVFHSEVDPRLELANPEELSGAMRLIYELQKAGLRVIVSNASSEAVLWKAAGAESCAAGKFFNIRRFTVSRFGPESSGFGNLPYWFEENLLAFVRQSDFARLNNAAMLSAASRANPSYAPISAAVQRGQAWLGASWRQFLYWFADIQDRYDTGSLDVEQLILNAADNWQTLSDRAIFMEEKRNKGGWLEGWLTAVRGFASF